MKIDECQRIWETNECRRPAVRWFVARKTRVLVPCCEHCAWWFANPSGEFVEIDRQEAEVFAVQEA